MTEKQYRLNKWGTRLLKNNRPLFDWTNEADDIVDLLNKFVEENEQLLKEKIDAETKLYKANEQLLMQMDYDNLCKENQDMEFELIKIKKENEQLKIDKKNWYIQESQTRVEIHKLKKENEALKQDTKQVLFVLSCAELDFKLSVNEAEAIKRLNDYVNGCFNTEKLGDVE